MSNHQSVDTAGSNSPLSAGESSLFGVSPAQRLSGGLDSSRFYGRSRSLWTDTTALLIGEARPSKPCGVGHGSRGVSAPAMADPVRSEFDFDRVSTPHSRLLQLGAS